MFWPVWILLTATFSVLAFLSRQSEKAETLAVILIGLFSVQIAKEVFTEPAIWAADCIIWIIASVTVSAIRDNPSRQSTGISVLLMLAALCIPFGRFAGEAYAIGSTALLFSDVFGALALLWLGSSVFVGLFKAYRNRGFGLGSGDRTGVLGHSLRGGQK